MFYVSDYTLDGNWVVTDTSDGISEIHTESTLKELVQKGIPIAGAMGRSVKVVPAGKINQFYCGDFIRSAEYDFLVHAQGKPDKDVQHRIAQRACFFGQLSAYSAKAIYNEFPPTLSPVRYAYIKGGMLYSALSHYYSDGRYGISPDKGSNYDYSIPQKPCLILNTEDKELVEWNSGMNFLRLDHLNPPTPIYSVVNVPSGAAFCFGSFLSSRGKGIYVRYYDTKIRCEEIESVYNKVKNGELQFVNLTVNGTTLVIDGMQGLIQYDMNIVWAVYKKTFDSSKRVIAARAKLMTATEVRLYDNGTLQVLEATKDGKVVIPEGTVTIDSDAVQLSDTLLTYLELPSTLKTIKSDAVQSRIYLTGSAKNCPPVVLNIKLKDFKAISVFTDRFSFAYGHDNYNRDAYQRKIIIDKRSSPESAFLYAVFGYWCRKNVYLTLSLYTSMMLEWANMHDQMINDNVIPDLSTQYKLLLDVVKVILKDFDTNKVSVTLATYTFNNSEALSNLAKCYQQAMRCTVLDMLVQTASGSFEASIANIISVIASGNADKCEDQLLRYSYLTLVKQAEEYRNYILGRAYNLFGNAIELTKSRVGHNIDFSNLIDRNYFSSAAREINRRVKERGW